MFVELNLNQNIVITLNNGSILTMAKYRNLSAILHLMVIHGLMENLFLIMVNGRIESYVQLFKCFGFALFNHASKTSQFSGTLSKNNRYSWLTSDYRKWIAVSRQAYKLFGIYATAKLACTGLNLNSFNPRYAMSSKFPNNQMSRDLNIC